MGKYFIITFINKYLRENLFSMEFESFIFKTGSLMSFFLTPDPDPSETPGSGGKTTLVLAVPVDYFAKARAVWWH